MIRNFLLLVILEIIVNGCINKKITENDIFNPVKEYELNNEYVFNKYFIQNSDSINLEIWYLTEKKASFNLIYFSGNGSNIRSAIPFFNELGKQFDLNIFSFNYRGYGLSEGSPSIDNIIEDGNFVLDYFGNEIGDDNLPTIVFGYSLGGFVALNLINHEIIDQGIIMSSFTSLNELKNFLVKEALPEIIRPFLKLEIDESIYKLNNIPFVSMNQKPVLFIHGETNDFIPPYMSLELYNLSPAEKKQIKIIENSDHRMVLKDSISNKQVVLEIKHFLNL